jgi:hypothetical protein
VRRPARGGHQHAGDQLRGGEVLVIAGIAHAAGQIEPRNDRPCRLTIGRPALVVEVAAAVFRQNQELDRVQIVPPFREEIEPGGIFQIAAQLARKLEFLGKLLLLVKIVDVIDPELDPSRSWAKLPSISRHELTDLSTAASEKR